MHDRDAAPAAGASTKKAEPHGADSRHHDVGPWRDQQAASESICLGAFEACQEAYAQIRHAGAACLARHGPRADLVSSSMPGTMPHAHPAGSCPSRITCRRQRPKLHRQSGRPHRSW